MAGPVAPLRLMFASGVLVHGAYDAIRVLVSYRVINLGGDGAAVGLVAASFALVPLLVALRIGHRVDTRGSWAVMLAGGVLSLLACLLILLGPTLAVLAAGNALLGLGQVMTFLAGQGVVVEQSEPHRFVNGFALFSLSVAAGQSLGTPVAGLLVEWQNRATGGVVPGGEVAVGWALLTMSAAIALALPLMAALPRVPGATAGAAPGAAARAGRPVAILGIRGMPAAIYASLVVLTGIDLITAYLPVVGQAHGIAPLTVTLLVALRSVFSMVSRGAMPLLLRIADGPRLLTWAMAGSAPAILGVALTGRVPALALLLAVVGFCWGMSQPLSMNWVALLVDPGVRAVALSLRLTGNRLAQAVVPAAAGALTGPFGPGAVFIVSGALTAVAALTTATYYTAPRQAPGAQQERKRP
ncbi:MFS transporter [Corynebacterium sphenisci]|uniref:MFS transporter n=1 Tax=Corynebacterium sphenisci TaxID=191493 RepID=UPI00095263E5|nr:MFS transporter [Corynebacterium sphenisci]